MDVSADLADRIRAYPRRRTFLLPALHEVQDALGWLQGDVLELVGAHLRVPRSEVYGIASSFPDFNLAEPAEYVMRVCVGASCRLAGAEALRERVPPHATVREADCLFICGVGPAAEIDGRLVGRGALAPSPWTLRHPPALVQDGTCSRAVADTQHAAATRVGCAGNCWQAPAISADGGDTWTSESGGHTTWTRPPDQRLLGDVGRIDPLQAGGYDALREALSLGSDRVWELVRDSGLRGRGGAYFPVGAKWETARNTPAQQKFLLVNAEEGEPGIYKDRHLLEGDPHRVLEGVLIAALGIGATDVVIFVNGEAALARERLLVALEQARRLGAVQVPVEVRLGAGGYVLGEETALINAIHGQRAEPLARPPFPAVAGLQASPTVINNVESLTNLPDIIRNGPAWFRSVGTPDTPGTKLVSLAGAVRQPGLYEVPLGTTLRRIVDEYGGGSAGDIAAMLVGGPSGSILPVSLLDTPYDVQPLQAVGGVLGAGGIVPLTPHECVVAAVRDTVAYNSRESCGKCTPCREGTVRLLGLFDSLRAGTAPPETLETIDELNDVLAFGSLCGLGQMAPNPVRALLRHFPDAVREHRAGRCAAGVCVSTNGVA
ncbi:MAG TPA: NADH-ubiquinone oxidoreductase-F iron-sulfur binding region domain-containing protein [Chloroflexota bacterium]|nr:NADH-ubiquinone oxidoreductase-F iron-sulfur binding region domain-containing protein [Chloroflexota bacterium]